MMSTQTHKRAGRSPATGFRQSAMGVAIAHLRAPLRWIMILGERGGLTTGEIARLAGVSLDTVKAIQNRGRTLIQEEILMRVPDCHA